MLFDEKRYSGPGLIFDPTLAYQEPSTGHFESNPDCKLATWHHFDCVYNY